jgi:cell division protein FtsX
MNTIMTIYLTAMIICMVTAVCYAFWTIHMINKSSKKVEQLMESYSETVESMIDYARTLHDALNLAEERLRELSREIDKCHTKK